MLEYLYITDYNDAAAENGQDPILFNVSVHTIADKYDLPALVSLARYKFLQRARRDWHLGAFAEAVEDIYDQSTDTKQDLRNDVIRVCMENYTELFAKRAVGQEPLKLRDIANELPYFSADLADKMAKELEVVTKQLKRANGALESERYRTRAPSLTSGRDGLMGIFD